MSSTVGSQHCFLLLSGLLDEDCFGCVVMNDVFGA
jgi:hypothetical protein